MPTSIELLAPARDLRVGKAAIDCGADAVYIGAARFGARHAAGNSLEDIAELVQYAHLFGVKVWVTLNTLMSDDERKEAVQLTWQLFDIQVDGLIIQDLRLLNENLPPIRLHASTQCDNREIEHIQYLQDLGFKRVVLARELSLQQIQAIREATQIELEAFVHGALCVCYSGRCYLSEALTGRSANRGYCAQLCREKYNVLDKCTNEILHQKHILSLHDMNRINHLHELLAAGVTSFKIEGRLKDEDYVRQTVGAYRQALDTIFTENNDYCRASYGKVELGFEPHLEKTFHRGGIDYFLHSRTPNMANFETPKSTGEYIGEIGFRELKGVKGSKKELKDSTLLLIKTGEILHNGDGLTVAGEGFSIAVVGKDEQGWLVRPNKRLSLPSGASVYRNYDKVYLDTLHAAKTTRKLPLSLKLTETEEGFQLTAKILIAQPNFALCIMNYEFKKELAQKPEQARQNIVNQLSKLGDTLFYAEEIWVETDCFLPASVVNQWRREMVQGLVEKVKTSNSSRVSKASTFNSNGPWNTGTIETFETSPNYLMTTKYCLLHELGQCRKQVKTGKPEPYYIRRADGKILRLQFDCAKCEMQILNS